MPTAGGGGGVSCTPDGLWDGSLLPGQQFARRFPENPGTLPYFCTPHCTSGHKGEIVVTDPILLTLTEDDGVVNLSWTGGGLYRVFRSPNPLFVGTGQVELVPAGGPSGTTLTDTPSLRVGEAVFYHVSNQ